MELIAAFIGCWVLRLIIKQIQDKQEGHHLAQMERIDDLIYPQLDEHKIISRMQRDEIDPDLCNEMLLNLRKREG